MQYIVIKYNQNSGYFQGGEWGIGSSMGICGLTLCKRKQLETEQAKRFVWL